MKLGEVQHIAISVSDMEQALKFYCGVLGLEVMMDFNQEGDPAIEAMLGLKNLKMRYVLLSNEGAKLNLLEFKNPKGENVARKLRACDQAIHHFAMIVDDVDAAHKELKEKGVELTCPPQDMGIMRGITVRGPDGVVIELMQFLAR